MFSKLKSVLLIVIMIFILPVGTNTDRQNFYAFPEVDDLFGSGITVPPSAAENGKDYYNLCKALYTYTTEEALPEPEEQPEPGPVVLRFGGDVTMSSVFTSFLRNHGINHSFESSSHLTRSADITFFNLETSVGERGAPVKRPGFAFQSPPWTLQSLVNAGVDIVSLANNHTLDYGHRYGLDTIYHLDQFGIKHVGMGANRDEALSPIVIERNGLKVGFLAFTQILPAPSWRAGEDSLGLAVLVTDDDFYHMRRAVAAAKEICDILIVSIHFGTEYTHRHTRLQQDTARAVINAGADVIIGHHPHYLQGIEFYNGKPIFYSTGNYIFYKLNEEAGRTALFEIVLDRNGFVSGRLYPIHITGGRALVVSETSSMYAQTLRLMRDLSAPLGVSVDTLSGEFFPKVDDLTSSD